MDTEELHSSLKDLASHIDDLEESLVPLLQNALSANTSKLPLLDKAKLYVLITYAIESALFSYIHLNDTDAKEHPVFKELARVKQYFAKIKQTEATKPNSKLDKDAAGRFIKHALAGNDRYDREREERIKREKAGAKRKFEDMSERVGSSLRFEATNKKMKAADKQKDDEAEDTESAAKGQQSSSAEDDESKDDNKAKRKAEKLARRAARREKREAKAAAAQAKDTEQDSQSSQATKKGPATKKKKKSDKAPKGSHEVFQNLVNGKSNEADPAEDKKKKKSRKEIRQKAEDSRAAEMK